ncbi:iron-sulfur cluster assembly ATPase SufC [Staphylococcus aureus]|nr:iron-sulfur cluster assembly ATPase SufC [Staphylococcus aureus]
MASTLEIKDLHVSIEDKEILKGVNLTLTLMKYMRLWDQTGQVNQLYHLQLWDTQAMK